MKILIIEDEPSCMKLACLVLSEEGYDVTLAKAAEGAITEILRCEPEVILLDLELPGLDGLSFARTLKTDPKTRHIAVVAITAYPERYPPNAVMAAGCDGYITKPMNTRTLSQQLQDAVGKSK